MGTEPWQFVAMIAVGIGVVALWIMFVYIPRRTGEDTPPEPSKEDLPQSHEDTL
ncbi:MAG: hypothetical protein H0X71_01035 [Rubrobacter sp.]|nr:hypothetical protein [Rubrobacter sp.]